MLKIRTTAIILLILGAALGYFIYASETGSFAGNFKFKYGLDLDGGTHLTYRADTSKVDPKDVGGAMDSLRQTVERRINIFGVSEPIVQVEEAGIFSENQNDNRLIVELPGVTNIDEAIKMIGRTPSLEFKLASEDPAVLEKYQLLTATSSKEEVAAAVAELYTDTGLTGAQLKRADVQFDSYSKNASVSITFNDDGSKLLSDITKNNVGRVMAIFLDGYPISAPVIRNEITGGQAQITGEFTAEEAKKLSQDLNFGALPLPIELIETQSIGATLGADILNSGVNALIWGFIAIAIFLIAWYRLPGLIASFALVMYVILVLVLFKIIPVVLTAAGIAGFILSMGMAVDANVLIFERIKEELKLGLSKYDAIKEGTKRAWPSIRDGNLTSLISAIVLYWLSGTSVVKGFSLVFAIGVIASMITAIFVSRIWLLAVSKKQN